jgi:hypothetical protein
MLKTVLRQVLFSIILFIFSCAAPEIEMPNYEGIDVRDVIRVKNDISAIETEFSISFEKDDTEIKGDGVLNVSRDGNLSLRVYSLGFLAFELTSENGKIKSDPVLDRNKNAILAYGLRDCLFWWDIKDYEIDQKEGVYLLRNLSRRVWINGKTMLPIKQSVLLEDNRELKFYYEKPERAGNIWYPSKIKIELSRYSVTLNIKEILFVTGV